MPPTRTVSELRVKISGDIENALKGMDRVGFKAQRLGQRVGRAGRAFTRGFTVPIAGAAAGLLALTKRSAEAADQIDKMSVRTGLARETLQELKFAGGQLGVGLEQIEKAAEGLSRRIFQIERGTGDVAIAFNQLGVSLRDPTGELRDMSDLLPAVLSALQGIENPTERNAIAMQLFGRSAAQLVPLLEAGEGGLDRLRERARELGIVMDDEAITSLVGFKDRMTEVKEQLGAVGRELALAFLPVLEEKLIPLVQDRIVPALRRWLDRLKEINPEKVILVAKIAAVTAVAGPLLSILAKLVTVGGALLKTIAALKGAAALGGLATVLTPGGAVLVGLATFAGLLATIKLRGNEATESMRELQGVLPDAAQLAGVERRIPGVAAEVERVRKAVAEARARREAQRVTPTITPPTPGGPPGVSEEEKFVLTVERSDEAVRELNLTMPKFAERVGEVKKEAEEAGKEVGEFARDLRFSLSDTFASILSGSRSVADAMQSLFGRLADSLTRSLADRFVGALLPGFQRGGSFRVAGAGGPDSQLVAFRASPGEQVTVTPPGRGGAPIVVNVDARGATNPLEVEEAAERAVLRAAPVIAGAAERRIITRLTRPNFA